ncbi:hypothetical protein SK128_001841, partial [Halocaridina rubra]
FDDRLAPVAFKIEESESIRGVNRIRANVYRETMEAKGTLITLKLTGSKQLKCQIWVIRNRTMQGTASGSELHWLWPLVQGPHE